MVGKFLLCFLFSVLGLCSPQVLKKTPSKFTSRTNLVCEDHPHYCDFYWSRGWFTCNNGGALWEYCPKSCGFCGNVDSLDCKDLRKQCGLLKRLGYCEKAPRYMGKHCSSSCGICKIEFKPKLESGCKDYEDICAKWVRYGQCRKHYDARKYCPKSCRICGKLPTVEPPVLKHRTCEDKNPEMCQQPYFCARYQNKAKVNCQKTCKMCQKSGTCYDLLSICYWYKHMGHCKPGAAHYDTVAPRCSYSCGLCKS